MAWFWRFESVVDDCLRRQFLLFFPEGRLQDIPHHHRARSQEPVFLLDFLRVTAVAE